MTTITPVRTSSRLLLTDAEVDQFQRDGYVVKRGLFSEEELRPLQEELERDPNIRGSQSSIPDLEGKLWKVTIWNEQNDTYAGKLPRLERMLDNTALLAGEETYFWHIKLVRKSNDIPGTVDWHQGYAYWYDDCLYPNTITCSVAVDSNNLRNGCLNVVKGSHHMGRIDMVDVGGSHVADPERVQHILDTHEAVACELEAGDAVFFHANMLHGSLPNTTDTPRTLMHCVYNARSNQPVEPEKSPHRAYRETVKLPDGTLLDGDYDTVFEKHTFFAPEKLNSVGGQQVF
ncbi:phytanoyl-CoA dioxygenase family protein [Actinomadura fulvescens]|uniref:Phytanoyl-CoA dioxygenase family protein n=1 Tax=Actinomadura fulvescens TaxID=46160 RepID=A0ABN3PEA5_9ACTN